MPCRDERLAAFLEEIYAECNRPLRLNRDPLAIVASYPDPLDRELAGLVASTLAFGSVDLIMAAVRVALAPLGERPHNALLSMGEPEIQEAWSLFQYRYCFPKDIEALMRGARRAIEESGSLEDFFLAGDRGGPDVIAATASFASRLKELGEGRSGRIRDSLLPDPGRGSACKRLFLYLRWMSRRDSVDLGGWDRLDPARLVVPLDTHMARVCSERLHFIDRPAADLKRALAATEAFRLYSPADPVKYDFALTRPGIDPEPGDERFGCT